MIEGSPRPRRHTVRARYCASGEESCVWYVLTGDLALGDLALGVLALGDLDLALGDLALGAKPYLIH